MLDTPIPSPRAWHGPTLARARYLTPIPAPVLAELDAALAELRRAPVPTLLLQPEHFALAASARFMEEVRRETRGRPGLRDSRSPPDRHHEPRRGDRALLGPDELPRAAGRPGVEGDRHLRRAPRRRGVHAGHARRPHAGGARDAHRQQHGRGAPELREPLLPAAGEDRRHEHRVERGRGAQPLPHRAPGPAAAPLRGLLPGSPGVPGGRRGRDQLPPRLRVGRPAAHALQRPAHRAGLREDRARRSIPRARARCASWTSS